MYLLVAGVVGFIAHPTVEGGISPCFESASSVRSMGLRLSNQEHVDRRLPSREKRGVSNDHVDMIM